MEEKITIQQIISTQREQFIQLLQSENLPTKDLAEELTNFFVATEDEKIIGAIGLEIYEKQGLLRSLIVRPGYRNYGVASMLISELETRSRNLNLDSLYLLTETAENYFAKKGFVRMERSDAPLSLQQSSEFSHACPASAALMVKSIR